MCGGNYAPTLVTIIFDTIQWHHCSDTACPSGWTTYESTCFKYTRNYLQFEQAKSACEEEGATLAIFSSAEEQEAVDRMTSYVHIISLCYRGSTTKMQVDFKL